MNPFRGITVQIIVNGQSLPFYDDPDEVEDASQYTRQKYIEAVANSAFQVKILLNRDFDLCGINRLKGKGAVLLNIDLGQRRRWHIGLLSSEIEQSWAQGRPAEYTFKRIKHFCEESGQWVQSSFTFAELESNESSSAHLSITEALELGRLQLTIQRVKQEKRPVPALRSAVPKAILKEVPEKALKGRSIANMVSLGKGIPVEDPRPSTHKSLPIAGRGGKPVIFDLFYRPRRSLQMMGCIARSPSPANEIPANSSNDQSTASSFTSAGGSQNVLQEVQDLRARLAKLERGLNTQAESSDAKTKIKTERVRAVKREREDDDNGRPSQRRRMPAEIEHVDLTDD